MPFIKKRTPAPPAPPPPAFDTLPVSASQALKALTALKAYTVRTVAEKEKAGDLLVGGVGSVEESVGLLVTLKEREAKEKHMPVRITLPHPLIDPSQSPVCLITKDPQRTYKDLIASSNITFISKTVGITKLRGKHSQFEARRLLLRSHGLFLADKRIIPLLPGLLGKTFARAKKLPVGVDLTFSGDRLKKELEEAVGATYLRLSTGTCVNVPLGDFLLHTPEQLFDNFQAIVTQLAVKLPRGGFENIQAIHVKTGTSTALPVWNCTLNSTEKDVARFKVESEEVKSEKAAKKAAKEKKKAKLMADRKRKNNSDSDSDAEEEEEEAPPSSPPKAAPTSAKKSKKQKLSDSALAPPSVATTLSLVDGTPVSHPAKPVRPKLADHTSPSSVEVAAALVPSSDAEKPKKKGKKVVEAVSEVTPVAEAVPAESEGKKKKGKKDRLSVGAVAAPEVVTAALVEKVSVEVADGEKKAGKKEKKGKEAKEAKKEKKGKEAEKEEEDKSEKKAAKKEKKEKADKAEKEKTDKAEKPEKAEKNKEGKKEKKEKKEGKVKSSASEKTKGLGKVKLAK